jgi:hypothetical protein
MPELTVPTRLFNVELYDESGDRKSLTISDVELTPGGSVNATVIAKTVMGNLPASQVVTSVIPSP